MGQARKIISVILLLAAGWTVTDQAAGRLLDRLYFRSATKLSYALDGCDEELLVFGYSRARNHYVPEILTDSTGLSCYNFGMSGQVIYYHYALLNTVLSHHKPHVVVLELGLDEFKGASSELPERLSQLAPLYRHNDTVADILRMRGPWERYKFYSRLYAFNSVLPDLLYAVASGTGNVNFNHRGFIPLEGTYRGESSDEPNADAPFNEAKIACIGRFVETCRRNGIGIVVAVSPALSRSTNGLSRFSERLVRDYGVEVWDYSGLFAAQEEKDRFMDPLHLNRSGAERYSRIFASDLRRKLGLSAPQQKN